MNLYPNTRGSAPRHKDKKIRVATHLDVIKMCLESINVEFVVEHGMGIASTPFFHNVKSLKRLLSFENEKQWQKCDLCPSSPLEHIIVAAPTNNDFKHVISEQIETVERSLALVDGPGPERFDVLKACVELGFPFIVEHDAETMDVSSLNDRKILVSERGYAMCQYVTSNPETMLYVKEKLNVDEYLKYGYIIV